MAEEIDAVMVSDQLPSTAQEAAEYVSRALPPTEQDLLAANVVQCLDSPERQRAAAEGVVVALPNEAKQDLAATVVQSLDTPEQQRVAAEGVVGALPTEAKQDLAATVVQSMDTPEQRRAAADGAMRALSPEQQQQVARGVLGQPDQRTRQVLWYIVVSTMALAVFVFGTMAFMLMDERKPAEAPLALATTALGGLVGLVATSPGGKGGD